MSVRDKVAGERRGEEATERSCEGAKRREGEEGEGVRGGVN